MKLAVFDFDSTLMDGETMDIIAQEIGVQDKVKQITALGMAGKIDFYESLTRRGQMLKGLSEKRINDICADLPPMPGAPEVIQTLKQKGFVVVCFSGGFHNATDIFQKRYQLDATFANFFHTKDGLLTGQIGGEMMFSSSKGHMIQTLQNLLHITPNETLAAGDGANDISMFPFAHWRVAFCAKPVVRQAANIIIDTKDLRALLPHIEK